MDADKVARLARILPRQDVAGQNGIVSHLAKIVFACGKVVREVMEPDQSVWECAACLADVMDTTTWPAEMIKSTRMQSWWSSSLAIQRMMISAWLLVELPASPPQCATAVTVLRVEAPEAPSEAAVVRLESPLAEPVRADESMPAQTPEGAPDPGPSTADSAEPPNGPGGGAAVLYAVPLARNEPAVGAKPVGTTSALAVASTVATDDRAAQVGDQTAKAEVPPLPPPPLPP
jgi:hypothetical protein